MDTVRNVVDEIRVFVKRAVVALWGLIKRHPVRAQALVVATIAVGSAFGLGWNGGQVGAVSAFSAALLAFITESAVTPLEKPVIAEGSTVTVTTADGMPDRTVTA